MAAAKLSRTPSLGSTIGSSRSGPPPSGPLQAPLSRTRGILLETMQLVEPRKDVPVPNHLLESKIYSKIAQNSVAQARPAALHFGGFEIGRTQTQVLQLANVSTEVQRMHIIPPQTKYFYIKYTKNDRLVPGLTLDCTVEFTPDEWRYYYDCIRVHCPGEENLVIPIHAYPIMNTSEFPQQVTFPPVPVGHSRCHTIPLQCHAPIDFEFQLTILQPHPAFSVNPMAGVVPANGEVDVYVTFSPSEFSTASMKLQLKISQFNAEPLVCTITGSSSPGLAKELSEKSAIESLAVSSALDPRAISPLDRARKNKTQRKAKPSSQPIEPKSQEIEIDGIKFPVNLENPYAVAQVLNQEPGKLRIKDLRDAVSTKKGRSGQQTRQMKEAVFEMAVRKDVYEERQNQLRWQVKIGEEQISPRRRQQVVEMREHAWTQYKLNRGDPVEPDEYRRSCTECTFRRTRRDADQVAEDVAKFDMYTNNLWAARHAAIDRFRQAGRKVLIRLRADWKIRSLRQTVLDWGARKYSVGCTLLEKQKAEGEEEMLSVLDDVLLEPSKVSSVTFPTYIAPDVKDDMAVDALGVVPYKPTEVIVKKKTPYFNLQVPQVFRLMGYQTHNAHDASSNYISPKLVRPLRTGAEDEIINLPPARPDTISGYASDTEPNMGNMKLEDVTTPVPTVSAPEAETLKPPNALFRPIDYPPLHIFNPTPGLQVFQPPLPYAETDSDFHLCPLPRYASTDATNLHMSTQRRYLDREDVIRGVMGWKRFPSQGLTSLANTPTLTSVWVPRWSDVYGADILPHDVPQLFDGLPEQDRDTIQDSHDSSAETLKEEEEEQAIELTPEMLNAQFTLIDSESTESSEEKPKKGDEFPHGNKMPSTNIPVSSTGPVPREKREQELDYFLRRRYNRLGNKIQGRVNTLNNLKTNPDLVLK